MLKPLGTKCALCQYRSLFPSSTNTAGKSWVRLQSTVKRKERPLERMVLSSEVATRNQSRDGGHARSGAFGGMNRTTPPTDIGTRRIRRVSNSRSRTDSVGSHLATQKPSTFDAIRQERTQSTSLGPFGAMNRVTVPESVKIRVASPPVSRGPPRLTKSPKSVKKSDETPKRKEGEYHALKMQKTLGTISYNNRMRVKREIAEMETFDDFDLLPLVRDAIGARALGGQVEIAPTPIQKVAIPALLQQRDKERKYGDSMNFDSFLLAAETGSGKTLAYLLPILDHIKRAEAKEKIQESRSKAEIAKKLQKDPTFIEAPALDDRYHHTSGRPRAIILLPTAELVAQVAGLIRQLSFDVKVRSDGISATYAPHVIKRKVFSENGIDILIATPHLLESIAFSDPNILSRVRHLVIDEADSLLDRSFSKAVDPIIEKCTPSLEKLILCSATIPQNIEKYLARKYPDMTRLVTPNLHAIPRRVQLSVVDIERDPYRGNRDIACADVIHSIGKSAHEPSANEPAEFSVKRIIVFVNEREKTVELADYLKSKSMDAVAMHRDTEAERRSDLLKSFTIRPPHQRGPNDLTPPENFKSLEPTKTVTESGRPMLANTKILVTTDIASRGIDTLAVRNVILYDVPHSTIDFIHRLGRTGRMKMRGRGIVLVGRHDRRDIVKEVKDGMFRGQALI